VLPNDKRSRTLRMKRMRSRRAVFLLGLAAALSIGILLRLSTYRQLQDGARTRAVSDDDYYHLRRARFAVAHFPRTILFDPLMNFPAGGVAIWPPLFDLALALPSRMLHGPDASGPAVEHEAAWVPLFFAAGSIALAGLLARRLYGAAAGAAASLFVAVSPGHLLWSQYGHVEQHVAESFFGLAALFSFAVSRENPDSPRNALREAAAGVVLALAVLAWQGAVYWGAIFALALFLEALLTRRSVFRAAALTLGGAAVIVGVATAAWTRGVPMPFTYVSFGFFQPLFLVAVAAGTVLLDTIVGLTRRPHPRNGLLLRGAFLAAALAAVVPFAGDLARSFAGGIGYVAGRTREASGHGGYVSYPTAWLKGIFEARPLFADGPALPARHLSLAHFFTPVAFIVWARRALARRWLSPKGIILRGVFLAAALAAVVPFAPDLVRSFAGGVGYVAGRTQEASGQGGYVSYPTAWLKGIFEARPLFADGPSLPTRHLSLALFFTPFAIFLWARRALTRKRGSGLHVALVVWGAVTLFLALSQRVNEYYAVPLCALALVEAARRASSWIRTWSPPRRRPPRARVAVLVGLVLALPMAAGVVEEVRSDHVAGSDLFATLGWMRRAIPRRVDPYDPRLLGPRPGEAIPPDTRSVLAPWSLGHLILYEAELPVAANNFGYGFLDSIRFFLASTEEEALAIANAHRARWILAADLVPRMNDYALYLNRPPLLKQGPNGLVPESAYFKTMQSRLYDFDGKGGDSFGFLVEPVKSFRLVFASRTGTMRGGRFVARWKVFETTPELSLTADRSRTTPPAPAGAREASPPSRPPS
jgi:asparagine N-glycosylation enzyme membrane subunit Stt3